MVSIHQAEAEDQESVKAQKLRSVLEAKKALLAAAEAKALQIKLALAAAQSQAAREQSAKAGARAKVVANEQVWEFF